MSKTWSRAILPLAFVFVLSSALGNGPLQGTQVGVQAQVANSQSVPAPANVVVRGRAVDAQTKRPVAGVSLRVIPAAGGYTSSPPIVTDTEGRYAATVNAGAVKVRIVELPPEYTLPRDFDWNFRLDAQHDAEWPDLELTPAVKLSGVVVDESGHPVAGADVVPARPYEQHSQMSLETLQTDADGRFTVAQLDPEEPLPLRARTLAAATDGAVVIVPSELTSPVELVVSAASSFHVRGRVVDRMHQPVAGVAVEIWWLCPLKNLAIPDRPRAPHGFAISSLLQRLHTGPDGRFESEALWPGDNYKVRTADHGAARAESRMVQGEAGETVDAGTLVLQRANRTIAGRVVDSAGRPVPGAHVVNSGDAPQPVRADTDAEGRFQLAGLFDGPAYVCVGKEGFRFTGRRVPGDTNEVMLTLRRPDERTVGAPRAVAADSCPVGSAPAAASAPAETSWVSISAELPFAEQSRPVRELLEWAWSQEELNVGRAQRALVCSMARLDAERAAKWSAEMENDYDDDVRAISAYHTAFNVEATLKALERIDDALAVETLRRLARRLEVQAPDKALRYAEAALVRARGLDDLARANVLAGVGLLLFDFGRRDLAQTAIRQAADTVADFSLDGAGARARATVAAALAVFDLPGAQKLIEDFADEHDQRFASALLPAGAARSDPNAAIKLLGHVREEVALYQATIALVYVLGATDPDRAAQVADSLVEPGKRAEAFGWLAVAAARRDRPSGWTFIDRGFAVLETPFPTAKRAPIAARLLYQAREIGYPDLESLAWRTVALRTCTNEWDARAYCEFSLQTISVLALSAPELARRLMADFPPIPEGVDRATLPTERRVAQVLADPAEGCRIIRAMLEAQLKDEDVDRLVIPWYQFLDLLTIPRTDQHDPRNPLFLNLFLWFPDAEPR
ncbi:MAG: carboxypeptidase-like regulatory domain-containing protein [Planctomycetota bacterium]